MVKKACLSVLLCLTLLMSTVLVHADAYSDWLIFPSYNSVGYSGQTSIHAASGNAKAYARTKASTSVAAGRIGAVSKLYRSTGSLVTSSAATYNSGSATLIRAETNYYYGTGSFFAGGTSYVYKSGSYASYSLINSPIQTASLEEIASITNENGEVYGSEYFLNMQGVQPDLILAEGIDGIVGYVKSDDLNAAPETLEEVLSYHPESYEIPLYEDDGETVIGSFIIEEPISYEE